jgi:ABC-type nitrate/sulfonate/bicarbonate transport system permease component
MSHKAIVEDTERAPFRSYSRFLGTWSTNVQHAVSHYIPAVALVLVMLTSWEIVVHVMNIPAWLLPPPSRIAATLVNDSSILRSHIQATMITTTLGFALSLATGFTLAFVLDASTFLRRAIYPLLIFSQTMPTVAIAPLLVVGLGFGILPKILVVALVTFFPIVVNTVDGLRASDQAMIRLMQAMDAKYWQQMWLLRFPSALPSIFSGLKIAVTYSVIGAVLAEWIGAKVGLGVYISRSLRAFRTDQVFVAILATSLLTLVLFLLTMVFEQWLIPWTKKGGYE